MRLERLASDKIKIFLSFDDLYDRGISKDEIWMDVPKVHDLFRDMINEASDELGFDAEGPVIVEVFALPSQGMIVIVTISDEESDTFDDSFIELQITLDVNNNNLLFRFECIEDVIQLSKELNRIGIAAGKLYHFEDGYILSFDERDARPLDVDTFVSMVLEFGDTATVTAYRLEEYGKVIIRNNAMKQLNKYFS
ncbi:genetic competence negative regulator [Evansella cellulosilytica]|uniref:Adapter protein MecA n=1 Tax=Evansella cellulosilytica (strain ATCC 21833 / DSM 2522 / FERM P-1141 / JCM 9156 / N-4) TaxID=649639 RepID=E6TYQ3_EVAC2|nr:genetic competence negative regulator [Evansella cellulosilytica]ADU30103.1 Negative regulator of genetic competence [Evansella cellulosilytica DSM 2522]